MIVRCALCIVWCERVCAPIRAHISIHKQHTSVRHEIIKYAAPLVEHNIRYRLRWVYRVSMACAYEECFIWKEKMWAVHGARVPSSFARRKSVRSTLNLRTYFDISQSLYIEFTGKAAIAYAICQWNQCRHYERHYRNACKNTNFTFWMSFDDISGIWMSKIDLTQGKNWTHSTSVCIHILFGMCVWPFGEVMLDWPFLHLMRREKATHTHLTERAWMCVLIEPQQYADTKLQATRERIFNE